MLHSSPSTLGTFEVRYLKDIHHIAIVMAPVNKCLWYLGPNCVCQVADYQPKQTFYYRVDDPESVRGAEREALDCAARLIGASYIPSLLELYPVNELLPPQPLDAGADEEHPADEFSDDGNGNGLRIFDDSRVAAVA